MMASSIEGEAMGGFLAAMAKAIAVAAFEDKVLIAPRM
jgi:hypothetical protein